MLATDSVHSQYRTMFEINYKIITDFPLLDMEKFGARMREESKHISIENFLLQGDYPLDPYEDFRNPSRLLGVLCEVGSMPNNILRVLETRIQNMVLAAYIVCDAEVRTAPKWALVPQELYDDIV